MSCSSLTLHYKYSCKKGQSWFEKHVELTKTNNRLKEKCIMQPFVQVVRYSGQISQHLSQFQFENYPFLCNVCKEEPSQNESQILWIWILNIIIQTLLT